MQHTYQLTGMTCSGCEAKVKHVLSQIPEVTNVEVDKDKNEAIVTMNKHVPLETMQAALPEKYQISAPHHIETVEETRSWFATYKPILLIFFYISIVSTLAAWNADIFDLMDWMRYFMAGFFLTFSFFKMLDLKGFAESYQMYDVVARRIPAWGYIYAFIELGLGVAFLANYEPTITNLVTLIVMSVSIIGVLSSVLNKRKIQCACLGAVFNLPMSTVTIIEDGLMIVMSVFMLLVN